MSAPTLPRAVFVVFVFDEDECEWQTEYVAEGRNEADDHEADILSRTDSRTCVVRYMLPMAPAAAVTPKEGA